MNKVISNLVRGAKHCAATSVKKAKSFASNPRMGVLAMMLFAVSISTFAQDVDAGLNAIEKKQTNKILVPQNFIKVSA